MVTERVKAAVRVSFEPSERSEAIDVRTTCGNQARDERVQSAVLKLADSDLGRLRHYIGVARIEFRDVSYWAEHPDE